MLRRDLTSRPRGVYVIDFGMMEEAQARQYAVPFDLVRARVKPHRDSNKREGRRIYWWRFGEPNQKFREATEGLQRYIATPETTKHRCFTFLPSSVAPDNMLVCIASDDAFHLGVLSSMIHVGWALAAGGRLGVGNDPRYNKTRCFDAFPFPAASTALREQIGAVAERIDWHRKDALARSEAVTMTGMYNVLTKLRSGEDLTAAERKVYELAACGVLRDLHAELDAAVAQAYGWLWPMENDEILARLVALHDERAEEEKRGVVRWLRPNFQLPRFGSGVEVQTDAIEIADVGPVAEQRPPWPAGTVDQIRALQSALMQGPRTAEEAAAEFYGARRDAVERHLETLALMGEVQRMPDGHYLAISLAA